MTDAPATREHPWPVALLSGKLKDYIDRLGTVWVEGEITQWGVSGGNVYGKLKDLDADATLSFTMWSSVRARLDEQFKQGDRVVALVKPNWWVKGGSLSMQVFEHEARRPRRPARAARAAARPARRRGALRPGPQEAPAVPARRRRPRHRQRQRRRERRAAQRPAALARRRVPRRARGGAGRPHGRPRSSPRSERLDADPEVEVIIVARGGGDFQNLLGFSDERVVRAAAAASTPIVTAIGHEADRPLLDEVADLRASTPTDAAKRVVPDVAEELVRVEQARARLGMRLTAILAREIDRIGHLRSRPALADTALDRRPPRRGAHPVGRARRRARRALRSSGRPPASPSCAGTCARSRRRRTLDRGYAIVQGADGHVRARRRQGAPDGARAHRSTLADGRARGRLRRSTVAPRRRGRRAPNRMDACPPPRMSPS